MSDVAAFLAARLDEDEASAKGCMNCGRPVRRETTKTGWTHSDRSAVGGGWQGVRCPGRITGALPWPDPARVLREVTAARRILNQCAHSLSYKPPVPVGKRGEWALASLIVEALAAVWCDHPDYDEKWRPGG